MLLERLSRVRAPDVRTKHERTKARPLPRDRAFAFRPKCRFASRLVDLSRRYYIDNQTPTGSGSSSYRVVCLA